MKTIKQASVFSRNVQFVPSTINMKQGVIYVSREFQTASHLCLCECGCLVVTPLSDGWWTLNNDDEKGVTMTPSIGNFQFKCNSHYIITNGIANFV